MTASATAEGRRQYPSILDDRRRAVVTGAAGVAALGLLARVLIVTLVNAPTGPTAAVVEPVAVGATALAGAGTICFALTETDPVAGVGLLFVGVFGLLSLAVPAVAVPAAVAVVGGTATVAITRRDRLPTVHGVAIGALLVALAVCLASAFGKRVI
jgi:hypothetical protein